MSTVIVKNYNGDLYRSISKISKRYPNFKIVEAKEKNNKLFIKFKERKEENLDEDAIVGGANASVATGAGGADSITSPSTATHAPTGLTQPDIVGKYTPGQGFLSSKKGYENNYIPDVLPPIQTRPGLNPPHQRKKQKNEAMNTEIDSLTMDVPLFIRLLEYAREDVHSDLDLHFMTENLLELSQKHSILTMADYDDIVDIEVNDKKNLDENKKKKKRYRRIRNPRLGQYIGLLPMIPWLCPHHHKPDCNVEDQTSYDNAVDDTGATEMNTDIGNMGADAGGIDAGGPVEEAEDDDKTKDIKDNNDDDEIISSDDENDQHEKSNDENDDDNEEKDLTPPSNEISKINTMSNKAFKQFILKNFKKEIIKDPKDIINSSKLEEKIVLDSIAYCEDGTYFLKFSFKDDANPKLAHVKFKNGMMKQVSQNEKLYSSVEQLKNGDLENINVISVKTFTNT